MSLAKLFSNDSTWKALGALFGMGVQKLSEQKAAPVDPANALDPYMIGVDEMIADLRKQVEEVRVTNGADAKGNIPLPVVNLPFRLKRNEVVLGASRARRGTHQATGRGKVRTQGFVVSVPIVQGLRWRASFGSGQVKPEMKWVFNEEGVLWFTNQRIIFDGSNRNTTIQLSKVLNLGFANGDASLFYLDIENGKDAMFNLQSSLSTIEYALIHLHLYDNDLSDWLTVSN